MTHTLWQLVGVLSLMAVVTPFFYKAGLGVVLPNLLIGIVVGASGFHWLSDEVVYHRIAEFGVVVFLFLVGLEVSPSQLWRSRHLVLGFGLLEVASVSLLATLLLFWLLPLSFTGALTIGMVASLSSTAFVMSWITRRHMLGGEIGQASLAVLLFQDVVVVFMILLIQLLARFQGGDDIHITTLFIEIAIEVVSIIIVPVTINFIFRYVVTYTLKSVVASGAYDAFIALSLVLVLGAAALTEMSGLSLAFGGFIAGMLLADSLFRHTLASNLTPFKGVLFGFFFVMIGSSINLHILTESPLLLVGVVFLLMVLKALVFFALASLFKMKKSSGLYMSGLLSQGGEFGYVILLQGGSLGFLDPLVIDYANVGVALSLLVSPFVLMLLEKFITQRTQTKQTKAFLHHGDNLPVRVVVVGAGRFGEIIIRILLSAGVKPTVLEDNLERIEELKHTHNIDVHFGDGSNFATLHSAGIESARLIVLAHSSFEVNAQVIHNIRHYAPHLRIFVRAHNHKDAKHYLELGAHHVQREVFLDAVAVGEEVLGYLSDTPQRTQKILSDFKEQDHKSFHKDTLASEYANSAEKPQEIESSQGLESQGLEAQGVESQEIGLRLADMPHGHSGARGRWRRFLRGAEAAIARLYRDK